MKEQSHNRKLTRLVLAALLCTGGIGWSSVASAEYSWDGVLIADPISHDVGGIYYLNPASGEKSLKLTTPGQTSRTTVGGYVNGNTPLNGYTITLSSGGWTSIYGAWAAASSHELVSQNTVTVEGGGTQGSIFGGLSTGYGNVEKNTVNIKAGKVGYSATDGSEVAGQYICGGRLLEAGGNATGNNVNISGGSVNAAVYGAYADELSGNSNVTDNHVTITGGTVKGGIVGGQSSYSAANNNTVTISGGTITGTVIGGQSSNGGNANNNIVTISGGTIDGMVTGGMATGNGNATGNIVNILVPITLQGINGGSVDTGTSSGNTVNIAAKNVNLTYNIYGTQNLNFYLPSDIAAGDTMLTVNEGTTELTGVTIGAAA